MPPTTCVGKSDGWPWFTDPGLRPSDGLSPRIAMSLRMPPMSTVSTRLRRKRRWWPEISRVPSASAVRTSRGTLHRRYRAPTFLRIPTHIRVFDVHGGRMGARVRGHGTWLLERGPHRCGRQPVVGGLLGGRGLRRRALSCPRRHLDRQDPPAGALRQPLLWRRQKEPAVHNLFAVAIPGVRRDERGSDTL